MSVRKLTANVLAGLVLLGALTSAAYGQRPGWAPAAQDPMAFDPDFRWFEPIYDMDLQDMKPLQRASTGWFATYDRLHFYASRPTVDNPNASDKLSDNGYGHRYEIGFMLPHEHHGWFFTYSSLDVGGFFTLPTERLNRLNEDQLDPDGEVDPAQPPFGFPVPPDDGNTPGYNSRIYFVNESENVFKYYSYELQRTWRLEPFHYGGILEPTVGFRWMQVHDLNARQTYLSTLDVDLAPPGGDPPLTEFGDDVEQLINDGTFTENDILTAEFGFRYTRFRQRFVYSADARAFVGASLQSSKSSRFTQITIYSGSGIGSEVDNILRRQTTPIYSTNQEFSAGYDLRGSLAYDLTRDISIRFGLQMVHIAQGVWRGGSQNPARNVLFGGDQNQDLLMGGASLGITLNR